jgi:hypothetical protein
VKIVQDYAINKTKEMPNDYIGEALGVHVPFGAQSPFKPSLHQTNNL